MQLTGTENSRKAQSKTNKPQLKEPPERGIPSGSNHWIRLAVQNMLLPSRKVEECSK